MHAEFIMNLHYILQHMIGTISDAFRLQKTNIRYSLTCCSPRGLTAVGTKYRILLPNLESKLQYLFFYWGIINAIFMVHRKSYATCPVSSISCKVYFWLRRQKRLKLLFFFKLWSTRLILFFFIVQGQKVNLTHTLWVHIKMSELHSKKETGLCGGGPKSFMQRLGVKKYINWGNIELWIYLWQF